MPTIRVNAAEHAMVFKDYATAIPSKNSAVDRKVIMVPMKLNALMVRYIVNDVDAAIGFYTHHLGFRVSAQSGAHFALLVRENLQLVLSPPKGPGGGSQPMPDGRRPEPGGWNRMIVQSSHLESDIESMRKAGIKFRGDVVSGPGGRQILLEDPSGNPVELFEPGPESVEQKNYH